MDAVNFKQKLSTFTETWSPKVVGELNGQYVKVVSTVLMPNRWADAMRSSTFRRKWVGGLVFSIVRASASAKIPVGYCPSRF